MISPLPCAAQPIPSGPSSPSSPFSIIRSYGSLSRSISRSFTRSSPPPLEPTPLPAPALARLIRLRPARPAHAARPARRAALPPRIIRRERQQHRHARNSRKILRPSPSPSPSPNPAQDRDLRRPNHLRPTPSIVSSSPSWHNPSNSPAAKRARHGPRVPRRTLTMRMTPARPGVVARARAGSARMRVYRGGL